MNPNHHLIICRERELAILQELLASDQAEFLALYGRRRIGKTFLITQFFKNKGLYFELTGIKQASLAEQLKNFNVEFSDRFLQGAPLDMPPSDWGAAFTLLRHQIEKMNTASRIILFFDELPWLSSRRSGFLQALDHCWNRYLSRDKRIIIVVCGSAASWMIKKVIHNKGGLYGRLTREIRLMPFTLGETKKFLQAKQIDLDNKQLIMLYMVLGGVAKYLNGVRRGASVAQIINELCFSAHGQLFSEFNKLYSALFDNAQHHLSVVKALAKYPQGLNQEVLLNKVGLSSGGRATQILYELEASGFIMSFPCFGHKKKEKRYRLMDEYSLFYLHWMEGLSIDALHTLDENYWLAQQNSPAWNSWAGLAFESICLKHINKIKSALGLGGVITSSSGWYGIGAQVDLIIDRQDNCINLCEIKYLNQPFVMDKSYADILQKKKSIFAQASKTRKTLLTTLLTTYGAVENKYYLTAVDKQLTMDVLF